ncbi:MAG TPA: hypothetical protein VFN55_03060 [Solirubrobacteraceae bacterium]|nr:hypothetical protein [Solirubrobacteraceae bacterium]
MSGHPDPGALLARSTALPGGVRVILRLARVRDLGPVQDLVAREGRGLDHWEIARLLHSSPRERVVLCATALLDGHETVVGFGAVGLDGAGTAALVVADSERAPGVGSLLYEALLGRAESLARARRTRDRAA